MKRLSDYVDFNQMPAGRHVFGLTGAAKVLDVLSLTALKPRVDAAIEKGHATLEIEHRWAAVKGKKKGTGRGNARAIKVEITRQLSSIADIAQARTVGDADDPVVETAHEILDTQFPAGVAAIRDQPYEELLGTLDTMNGELAGAYAPQVETLGMSREVQRLARLTDELRAELRRGGGPAVEFHEVELARAALHEATCGVIVAVVDHFDGMDDPKQAAAQRERVLAELNRQQALVSEARSQHREPLDVNPQTGTEVDPASAGDATDGGGQSGSSSA